MLLHGVLEVMRFSTLPNHVLMRKIIKLGPKKDLNNPYTTLPHCKKYTICLAIHFDNIFHFIHPIGGIDINQHMVILYLTKFT